MAKKLREKHHLVIDRGYGPIKGKTFRLSNMGDETEETVSHLLACLDDCSVSWTEKLSILRGCRGRTKAWILQLFTYMSFMRRIQTDFAVL